MSAIELFPVHVACNDPDNGLPAHKVQAIQLDFPGAYLELGVCSARAPSFLQWKDRFRLGRYQYHYERSKDWVGNWCWNAYWLHSLQAARLVDRLMRDDRFACEGGYLEACDAWEANDVHGFMAIWRSALYPPAKAPPILAAT